MAAAWRATAKQKYVDKVMSRYQRRQQSRAAPGKGYNGNLSTGKQAQRFQAGKKYGQGGVGAQRLMKAKRGGSKDG